MNLNDSVTQPEGHRDGRALGAQHRRLARDIFLEALELDPRRRSDYLDQVCRSEPQVRSEVESLLQQAERRDVFGTATLAFRGFHPNELIGPNSRFRVIRWIAAGGMGDVYEAEDLELEKNIAIKTIRPDVAARPEMIARFKREIQIGQEVTHPNVCRVYDLGQHRLRPPGGGEATTLFMTMEMIGNAMTLSALLRQRGTMPVPDVIRIGRQIAHGIQALHAAGYIHRDLKPANIMVSDFESLQNCRAVVTDLGLARSIWEGHTIAAPGMQTGRSGTPEYMAPEQITGGPLTEATDVYSLGVILYQMATGRLPRRRLSSGVLEPRDESSATPKLPAAFSKIIRRCVTAEGPERFGDMGQLLAGLGSLDRQSGHSVQRRALWTRVAPAVGVVAAVLLGGVMYFRNQGPQALVSRPLTTLVGEEACPTLSADGNFVAFSWPGESGENEDIYVKLIGGGTGISRLTKDPGRDFGPAWSPDGKYIAYLHSGSGDEAEVRVTGPIQNSDDRLLATVLVNPGHAPGPGIGTTLRRELPVPYIAWSPDGKYLAVPIREVAGGPSSIWLVSTETGDRQRLTSTPFPSFGDSSPVFSPDGKRLSFSRTKSLAASDAYLLNLTPDLKPIGEPRRLTSRNREIHSMAWAPRSTLLIALDNPIGGGNVWRFPTSGDGAPEVLPLGNTVRDVAVSLRAQRMVFSRAFYDNNIWRLPLRDPGPTGELPVGKKFISSTLLEDNPQYSPDGSKIAFESNRNGAMEVWLCNADGENAMPLTKFGGLPSGTPRWSPDGKWIAFDHMEDGVWGIFVIRAEGGSPKRIGARAGDVVPSWSHDGNWIYHASNRTGRFEIWKTPVAGGGEVQVTRNGGFVAFESADGNRLFYTKNDEHSSLWTMPLPGGSEEQVADSVYERSFTVTENGVYYIPAPTSGPMVIKFLDFATRKIRDAGRLEGPTFEGLSVSPDGKYLLYTQTDGAGADLLTIDNFR
jgi:eukaryotic-like serine/threonine-protein kinase